MTNLGLHRNEGSSTALKKMISYASLRVSDAMERSARYIKLANRQHTTPGNLPAAVLCGVLVLMAMTAPLLKGQADQAALSNAETTAVSNDPTYIPTTLNPDLAEPVVPDNYVLGKGDLLSLFVFGMPDLTGQIRIATDGTIHLPLTSSPVQASGLTAPELAQKVSQILERDQLARNPRVRIIVRQVMSRPITVIGAVRNPVTFQANHPVTLDEAIARAGGTTEMAGSTVYIAASDAPEARTQTFSLKSLYAAGNGDNVLLHGGDIVRVPPAQLVYAVGAFQRPGAFPLNSGSPVSVLNAIALAQGIKDPADTKHGEIIRTDPAGNRTVVLVNVKDVLAHKEPAPRMEPGDIFYIPTNGKRQILTTVLSQVGQATVIAIGYGASKSF